MIKKVRIMVILGEFFLPIFASSSQQSDLALPQSPTYTDKMYHLKRKTSFETTLSPRAQESNKVILTNQLARKISQGFNFSPSNKMGCLNELNEIHTCPIDGLMGGAAQKILETHPLDSRVSCSTACFVHDHKVAIPMGVIIDEESSYKMSDASDFPRRALIHDNVKREEQSHKIIHEEYALSGDEDDGQDHNYSHKKSTQTLCLTGNPYPYDKNFSQFSSIISATDNLCKDMIKVGTHGTDQSIMDKIKNPMFIYTPVVLPTDFDDASENDQAVVYSDTEREAIQTMSVKDRDDYTLRDQKDGVLFNGAPTDIEKKDPACDQSLAYSQDDKMGKMLNELLKSDEFTRDNKLVLKAIGAQRLSRLAIASSQLEDSHHQDDYEKNPYAYRKNILKQEQERQIKQNNTNDPKFGVVQKKWMGQKGGQGLKKRIPHLALLKNQLPNRIGQRVHGQNIGTLTYEDVNQEIGHLSKGIRYTDEYLKQPTVVHEVSADVSGFSVVQKSKIMIPFPPPQKAKINEHDLRAQIEKNRNLVQVKDSNPGMDELRASLIQQDGQRILRIEEGMDVIDLNVIPDDEEIAQKAQEDMDEHYGETLIHDGKKKSIVRNDLMPNQQAVSADHQRACLGCFTPTIKRKEKGGLLKKIFNKKKKERAKNQNDEVFILDIRDSQYNPIDDACLLLDVNNNPISSLGGEKSDNSFFESKREQRHGKSEEQGIFACSKNQKDDRLLFDMGLKNNRDDTEKSYLGITIRSGVNLDGLCHGEDEMIFSDEKTGLNKTVTTEKRVFIAPLDEKGLPYQAQASACGIF